MGKLKKKFGRMIANLDLGKILTEYFLLTMGSVILAVNFDLFLAPFNIAPGGTSGAAIIIHEFTGWPKGLTMLVLTLPMLVIGFFFLGRFRPPHLECQVDFYLQTLTRMAQLARHKVL